MKGHTERLQRAFKKHIVKLYSKARYIVSEAVMTPKDPWDMETQGGVICECACDVYDKDRGGNMKEL